MKSTGEVMGIDTSFGLAFAKAQIGAGMRLPLADGSSSACVTRTSRGCASGGKNSTAPVSLSSRLPGTARYFAARGIPAEIVRKVQEGSPHIAEQIKEGKVAMVINTPPTHTRQADSFLIRRCALDYQVPYFTTIAGAEAAAEGIEYLKEREFDVKALQDYAAASLD
jgi:carbamoyl-phosphate synthase large subunit